MIKIAVTGPESSGKTTLSSRLAAEYNCLWVEEYSRIYLQDKGTNYTESDLLAIAQGQLQKEKEAAALSTGLLFCDTDMTVITIWSMVCYGRIAPELEALEKASDYHHTLLCRPDIPWEPDPLRENPHDRDRLFDLYEARLQFLNRPYTIVEGDEAQRLQIARETVNGLI